MRASAVAPFHCVRYFTSGEMPHLAHVRRGKSGPAVGQGVANVGSMSGFAESGHGTCIGTAITCRSGHRRHSPNGTLWILDRDYRDSDLMLAATITLPHLLVSSEMSLPKSAGDPESTVPARLVSRASNFGSAMLMLTSLFSVSMSSAGVFFGAPMPYHALAS